MLLVCNKWRSLTTEPRKCWKGETPRRWLEEYNRKIDHEQYIIHYQSINIIDVDVQSTSYIWLLLSESMTLLEPRSTRSIRWTRTMLYNGVGVGQRGCKIWFGIMLTYMLFLNHRQISLQPVIYLYCIYFAHLSYLSRRYIQAFMNGIKESSFFRVWTFYICRIEWFTCTMRKLCNPFRVTSK